MAGAVLRAETAEEVAEAIGQARRQARGLEARGGATLLPRLGGAARPEPSEDADVLALDGLSGIVDHPAADLTVTVRAGTPVAELASALAEAGQECPIEPLAGADGAPLGSTVGGRVSAALAGPRQLGAGRVRDWVLRVRYVTGEGRVAHAGGATVKDVTGYDLCRLLTGSWGTLAVLTEVTLKLRPRPPARAWYRTTRPPSAWWATLHDPAAIVTDAVGTSVLLEGHPDDVAEQADAAGLEESTPPTPPTGARAVVDPSRTDELVAAISELDCAWAAEPALGLVHLAGDATALEQARAQAERLDGRLLRLDGDAQAPVFGHDPGPDPYAGPLREALDPDAVLAPWRWSR